MEAKTSRKQPLRARPLRAATSGRQIVVTDILARAQSRCAKKHQSSFLAEKSKQFGLPLSVAACPQHDLGTLLVTVALGERLHDGLLGAEAGVEQRLHLSVVRCIGWMRSTGGGAVGQIVYNPG